MQISNVGTYRGRILEHAVNSSTNGFPQFVPKLIADEMYDEENKEWVGLTDTPETIAYLILVDGKENKTLNCQQVEKVTGWLGVDLLELENMNLANKPVQFRMVERSYQNNVNLQVEWIDEFDAIPGKGLRKLDATAIKAMQGKFGKALAGKKAPSPAKPPAKTPAKPPVAPAAKPAAKTTTPLPVGVHVPARKPTQPVVPTAPGKCTISEAFEFIVGEAGKALWKKDMDDQKVTDVWLRIAGEIAGERPDSELTPEECFTIQERVAKEVFMF